MSDIALRVEDLSKRYRIGVRAQQPQNLRQTLKGLIGSPFAYLQRALREPVPEEVIWALKDVSFEVKRGEVVGIIGRNGAGKTTLLKILSRITEPTEGYAEIHGRVGALLGVGTGFHPELTGRENIYLSGAILGMKKTEIDSKFDEILAFSGVEKFIDTPVKYYSSGMYVRLAFAIAAHLEPEILLVDEVLAVGDAAFQKKCLGKMDDVRKEGRTVLFVSHQLEMILALCQRCLLLQNGRITHDDDSRSVIDTYYSSFQEFQTTSLRERTDRQGRGRFRFVDTWVEDENGNRVQTVNSGRQVKFVILYEVTSDEVARDTLVGIGIHTPGGMYVANLGAEETGPQLDFQKRQTGRLECIIPKLSLNAGRFYYNLMARSSKTGGEIEDYVQQAGMFDVEPGQFFGEGIVVPRHVFMLMEHAWKVVSE